MPHDPQKLIEDIRISIREINDFATGKSSATLSPPRCSNAPLSEKWKSSERS